MLFIILYSLFPNLYGSYLNNNFVPVSDSSWIDTFTKVNKHTTASSVPGYFISCGTKLDGRMAEKSGVFDFKGPVNSIKLCATPCQGLYCSCAEAKGYGARFITSWIQLDLFSLVQSFSSVYFRQSGWHIVDNYQILSKTHSEFRKVKYVCSSVCTYLIIDYVW